jgi:hypothetical protein
VAQDGLPNVTKYYYLGSRRVALRTDGDLTYLHADHLGSASLATDVNGATLQNSDVRYLPFGEQRVAGAGMPTDRLYPGRGLRPTSRARDRVTLGRGDRPLRRARQSLALAVCTRRKLLGYDDPALGRFVSADTLVPELLAS